VFAPHQPAPCTLVSPWSEVAQKGWRGEQGTGALKATNLKAT